MSPQFRVLVADDDESIVWLWARILQLEFGAEVVAVFDGSVAIRAIDREDFDLVITDLQMAGATGLEVFERANRCTPPVPVIISTGNAFGLVTKEALRLGAAGVVHKPFDLDQATMAVHKVLDRELVAL